MTTSSTKLTQLQHMPLCQNVLDIYPHNNTHLHKSSAAKCEAALFDKGSHNAAEAIQLHAAKLCSIFLL